MKKDQPQTAELLSADEGQERMAVAVRPQSESERMFTMIERMATDPNVDPAKLREILSVKQNWEADEARKAFARDMAIFQSRCPIISKGDVAYDKKYARIDRIHRETRELRKECGFWFTWSVCEVKDGVAIMEGLLGHSGGHTVPLKQVIPLPEATKGMNATQRAGSSMTYAKRYGECLALDIVTGEDTDGFSKPQTIQNPDEVARRKEAVAALWVLLKPKRGTLANWDEANRWMCDEMILDTDEAMPNLPVERIEKAIEKVRAKI